MVMSVDVDRYLAMAEDDRREINRWIDRHDLRWVTSVTVLDETGTLVRLLRYAAGEDGKMVPYRDENGDWCVLDEVVELRTAEPFPIHTLTARREGGSGFWGAQNRRSGPPIVVSLSQDGRVGE